MGVWSSGKTPIFNSSSGVTVAKTANKMDIGVFFMGTRHVYNYSQHELGCTACRLTYYWLEITSCTIGLKVLGHSVYGGEN
jgi:hypothetical protein